MGIPGGRTGNRERCTLSRRTVPDPQTTTVLILDVSEESYNPAEVWGRWQRPTPSLRCPACGTEGRLRRHGSYHKYHFLKRIRIVRVRCGDCRCTHALIPSFSLPGLSIGSAEAERYLAVREAGVGRGCAAAELLACGMSQSYPKRLERMLTTTVTRGKALLGAPHRQRLMGLAWVRSVVGDVQHPLEELNRFGLAHGVNGICFCRASILFFCSQTRSTRRSHKKGSPWESATAVPSGP